MPGPSEARLARSLHTLKDADAPLHAAITRVAALSKAWHAEHASELLDRAEGALALGAPPRLREVLGISHREVPLNRTLGWLLDPRASHGAGSLLLASFARWLGADALAGEASIATAWCERRAEGWYGEREPDLLFRTSGAALLIENKVNAPEGPKQFSDYASAFARWAGPRAARTMVVMAPAPRTVPPPYRFRTHAELASWAADQAEQPGVPTWVRVVLVLLAADLTMAAPSDLRLRTLVERGRRAPLSTTDLLRLADELGRPRPTPWETR